jgi:hypothetical protein
LTATYYEQKIKLWTKTQCLTVPHILAVIGFGLLTYGSCYNTFILIFGLLAFCLITSYKIIWGMLLVSIIISALVAAFPPLFPVFIVLMLIFLFMRIDFIIENWRPIVAGLIFYVGAAFVASLGNAGVQSGGSFYPPIVLAVFNSFALHFILTWLYTHKYSVGSALGIMGSVPIIIICLLLPFITHAVDVLIDSSFMGDAVTFDTYNPNISNVPDPGMHNVQGYIRTNPDGIVENNLSYDGSGAYHDPYTETHYVREHVRTNPDGIEENNLSYRK